MTSSFCCPIKGYMKLWYCYLWLKSIMTYSTRSAKIKPVGHTIRIKKESLTNLGRCIFQSSKGYKWLIVISKIKKQTTCSKIDYQLSWKIFWLPNKIIITSWPISIKTEQTEQRQVEVIRECIFFYLKS